MPGNIVHLILTGYSSYTWNTGSNQDYVDITKPGTYSVLFTDNNGCKGADSIQVSYINCASVYIPNAFTPNGNGVNDVFRPFFPSPISNYHIEIYNRWGNKVYENNKSNAGWDGTYQSSLQPAGVYVYIFTFKKDIDGIEERRSGSLILIR